MEKTYFIKTRTGLFLACIFLMTLQSFSNTLSKKRALQSKNIPGKTAIAATAVATYKGQWIWKDGVSRPNCWMMFRKQINLSEISSSVLATIAVDSKYWLWVNGTMVVREGGLKRTPNPTDTYADTVNLNKYLIKGKNTIAILVWYWGKEGHGHNSSGQGGLFFEASAGNQLILSDDSWKVSEHPAFDLNLTGPQPYRPLSEYNVVFDARKDIADWFSIGYDDHAWQRAKTYGIPPIKPWGNLVIRQIPQWKDYGLKNYTNTFAKNSIGNILAMQLPYNAQVNPYFKIKAPAGLVVEIRTDKYTDGAAYNVRAEYITKDGVQEFEAPGWLSGEQVWYNFPVGVEILSLQYRETGYDAAFEGSFLCNDHFYNTLWEKARRTLYINMRDNFMDCPTRERAMWWGDVVTESLQSYYVFSPKVYDLTKKAIQELVGWQTDEGVLYSPIPGPHPPLLFGPHRELPLQSLAAISNFGLWDYYQYTGDPRAIIEAYPAVKKYLALWTLGNDGLVKHRNGKWNWQDWGGNIDAPLLDNTWYYSALQAATYMAVLSGNFTDTLNYTGQMNSIRDHFDPIFWNGKEYRSAGHQGPPDERGNAMAVITGLANRNKWGMIKTVLEKQYHASPYMEKYVLEALFKAGYSDAALIRMKNRYTPMVNSPISTLWELWTPGFNQTVNHGWTGGPLSLMMQYVAGISPVEPGFKTFSVSPQLGNLKDMTAVVPTKYGTIDLQIHRDSSSIKLILNNPVGTIALIDLTKDSGTSEHIYINNNLINPEFLKRSKEIKEIRLGSNILYQVKGKKYVK